MSILHVTLGGSAAESLRTALAHAGRDDTVIELLDDLAVGPLAGIDDSPEPRAAFWENALPARPGDAVWTDTMAAELARLATLVAGCGQIVIWHAPSAADQLMLRRVAYHLRNAPQRLNEVRLAAADLGPAVQARGDRAAVSAGLFAPEHFAARLPDAAPISVLRISRLALEWQETKLANAELRYWIDNTFKSGHFAEIDARVLALADDDWAPAARVVGTVIAQANRGCLAVSDGIAFWRCRELAAAGRIELCAAPGTASTAGTAPLGIDQMSTLVLRATATAAESR